MVREGSMDELMMLAHQIPEFENLYPREEFERRLSQERALILVAEEKDKLVGFKCGYPDTEQVYYSWMGGVLPGYRNRKFALFLLEEMESRVLKLGFKYVYFKTLNQHTAMLIFALKNGFEIVDVIRSSKDPKPRILLKKQLS